MNFDKTIPDIEQFGNIITNIVSRCNSLEKIGINPEAFKADARTVIATHVNNICADRLNSGDVPAPDAPDSTDAS